MFWLHGKYTYLLKQNTSLGNLFEKGPFLFFNHTSPTSLDSVLF